MSRGARAVSVLGLALLALGGAPAALGGDATGPKPKPLAEVALAAFDGDPGGDAGEADTHARELLDGKPGLDGKQGKPPDPAAAAAAWMDLAERPEGGLLEVPLPPILYGARGLWWPAREVALLRLAALPPAGRAAVEARWGARAAALLAQATESGDDAALARAAELGPCTRAGGDALLALADRDLERGEALRAAGRLSRWMRLNPSEPTARRAAVGARLLDARALAHDGVGAMVDGRTLIDIAATPVRRGDVTQTLGDVATEAMLRARPLPPDPSPAAAASPIEPPAAPEAMWSLSLLDAEDEDVVWTPEPPWVPGAGFDPTPAAAAVSVAAGAVWLAGPTSVRRVSPASGRVVWRFPAEPPPRARELAPTPPTQLPARGLAVADGRVFAVLGDSTPPSVRQRARRAGLWGDDGRESRARLVALDASTGRLLWLTGAPAETDPVLRARDVSVSSAPTVDGDRVWVTLCARRGAVECWLASFDAATGATRTVTYLGRGEAALTAPAQPMGVRLMGMPEQPTPVGEPPARAGDEVCVVPGAGFAAGVRASDGRLLWVQALPAHEWMTPTNGSGFSYRWWGDESRTQAADNVPILAHGSWFVAPAGSPAPAALEAGTGRLRWAGAHESLPAPPARAAAKHLLLVAANSKGVPRVLLGGGERGLLRYDGETGRLDDLGPPLPFQGRLAGRPWVGDGRVAILLDRIPRVMRFGADGPVDPGTAARPGKPNPWPSEGDLLRSGDVWLAVAEGRVTAIASAAVAGSIAAEAPIEPRERAARALLAFRRAPTLDAFDKAATAASAASDADSAQALCDAFAEALKGPPALRAEVLASSGSAAGAKTGLRRALASLDRLPASERAEGYLRLARLLKQAPDGAEALVDLCLRWTTFGAAGECAPDESTGHVQRGDLVARRLLRDAVLPGGRAGRLEPRAAAAYAAAERASLGAGARTVGPAGEAPEPWTAAAWVERAKAMGAALDAGAFAEAAAAAADLRLALPPATRLVPACAQALRAFEADAVGRAGEPDAARDVLHDALMAAGGAARGAFGEPGPSLAAALAARAGRVASPAVDEARSIDVESADAVEAPAGIGAPARVPALPAVVEPFGPGAGASLSRALVAREGALDVYDVETGSRVGTCPTRAGDAGLDVLDAEEYVKEPGALVRSLATGRPADAAGLREGDWIVAWDGSPVRSRSELDRLVAETSPGKRVEARILRDGRATSAFVVVAPRATPADPSPRAWMRTGREAVVLEPYGLALVDLSDAAVRTLWSAGDGPAASGFVGFADALYVTRGARESDACSLAAIDAATGRERWVAPLPGPPKGDPRVLGSAVVVDVQSPDLTVFLDAATGSRRATCARTRLNVMPRWSRVVPRERARTSVDGADAAGLTLLLSDVVGKTTPVPARRRPGQINTPPVKVTAVNPTTGDVEWRRDPGQEQGSSYYSFFDGGGVVALAVSQMRIEVFVPDLAGDLVGGKSLGVGGDKFGVHSGNLQIVVPNTKMVVRGDLIYLIRGGNDPTVSVSAIEIDRDGLYEWMHTDPVVWHPVQTVFDVRQSPVGSSPGKSTCVFADATLEGCWALSTSEASDAESAPAKATWYEPLRVDPATHETTRPDRLTHVATGLRQAGPTRTGAIVRVGSTVLVPKDRGFLVVPVGR